MKLTLTTKFFFNLLAAIVIVVIAMVCLIQYSFDRGFLDYVNTIEIKRLKILAESLENAYGKNGSWEFLRDNPRILKGFLRDTMPEDSSLDGPQDFPENGRPGRPGGPPGPPASFKPGMANRPPPHDAPEATRLFEHRVVLVDGHGIRFSAPLIIRPT